ncbi:TolC family outer membrane protein [Ramlibacter tataouinensis]|uniref:Outer membrane protein-like protein n=1 Tax=Ramlibacter tataouinensis (strain ATCC BAA-407 / DSM 14655 / LMG 21543 / TTB310) TaxID=365046 RepID=F5Y0W8_RAMTT|nr:TolC family outer membrane protein [Ramlibacter tataouinensis]AEG92186.1 outer membrane protein-like protein [Ramlibacter tataouinensis TTB310]
MTPLPRPLPRFSPVPLALLGATLLAAPVRAQTLLELYEAARGYDATWQSARAQYDANLHRAEQARAGILPQAGLSAGVNRTQFDSTVGGVETDRGFNNRNATLSASQPLYRPANFATWEQGKRQAELAGAQLTAANQDLIIRVSQAYFDVLAAQDTLAFVRAQKTAVAEQLASARRNFEVGTATITDTREAQARFDLVTAQEIAAENDLRVHRLALDTLVGKDDAQPVPLATPLVLPAPQPDDVSAWVQQSEQASPQIQQARIAREIAELETEKAEAGHKPTVDLQASYNLNRNPSGSTTFAGASRSNTGQVGIAFNLPLFAGFATQNRIRETLALEQRAQADLEAARRNVAQATRTAYFGVVSGQGQVRALEAAEASSQSALEANRLGYQVGVRINIDVLNAQSQLFQTKRDLAQARYNVLLGTLRLRQANGTLTEQDLARLNALVVR